MIIAETVENVRKEVEKWKRSGLIVGLVPTMGALHEGHASLVEAAASECDRVVASVFVNPTQFSESEDMESYPRDFENDCRILEEKGCHMVFHPEAAEMYPEGFATYVEVKSDMTRQLCGKSRPEHFKGVCTVVSKLFNIVTPDRAYFGEKDAQQLAVIRRMAEDLSFGTKIIGCPTVREEDGLAKSSRNSYLNEEERRAAAVLYKSMERAREFIASHRGAVGENTLKISDEPTEGISGRQVREIIERTISEEPLAKIDYVDAVDGKTLTPAEYLKPGDLVALAVYIGSTRLIDNFTVEF